MIKSLTSKKGFAILETIVGIGVFILFAAGIFSGIQFVFKSVYNSRLHIIETGILNEQVEIIRNMAFNDVGIVNGAPSGLLHRTVTTTRNNIDFTITRTIRDIDDPFDGLVGGGGGSTCSGALVPICHSGSTLCVAESAVAGHLGHGDTEGACESTPNDTSPADYKLVDISIICDTCNQKTPVSLTTLIAPKFLEGDPTHGALRVDVFENNYQSLVEGAEVHIVATSTSPTYDFIDTTNSDGQLLVVDLAEGAQAYHITVSKDGYTTAMTTTTGSNPVRPPASVVAQDLQSISFEINPIATINLSTIDSSCVAVGSANVHVDGEVLVSTDPNVFYTDTTLTTNASGDYTFTNLIADDYTFDGISHDVIGTIPTMPLTLVAGATVPLQLVLGPNTTHSLLVHVQDSGNGQPIASASVNVTDTGSYDETEITGIGHSSQTDWSGGSGQTLMSQTNRYFTDDGNVDVTTSTGNIELAFFAGSYSPAGWLESSTYDLGEIVNFVDLEWQPFLQPSETGTSSLRFQVATSATSTPSSWTFLGPDGTASTYYDTDAVSINSVHNGDRYFRYKAYFTTEDTAYTPTLSEISFSYTSSCTPPGQSYFGSLTNSTYTVDITATGYEAFTADVDVDGDMFFTASMTPL